MKNVGPRPPSTLKDNKPKEEKAETPAEPQEHKKFVSTRPDGWRPDPFELKMERRLLRKQQKDGASG